MGWGGLLTVTLITRYHWLHVTIGYALSIGVLMVTLKCMVCGKEHEAHYANKLYCSKACKQKAWRTARAARAAAAAPAREAQLAQLDRLGPKTGAVVRAALREAGPECQDKIMRVALQAAEELGPLVASAKATSATRAKAEGVPMK